MLLKIYICLKMLQCNCRYLYFLVIHLIMCQHFQGVGAMVSVSQGGGTFSHGKNIDLRRSNCQFTQLAHTSFW